MNRRGFLQTCIALSAAPALVRAESLMPMVRRTPTGLCYVVISDLHLADFGNAVPDFTMECFARQGPTVFGYARVAGRIVSASGITERKWMTEHRPDGSSLVTYDYSAKRIVLAVPPGAEVGKLWANGKQLPFVVAGNIPLEQL